MGAGMQHVSSWSRDIRLASGLVLLAFATSHFLNHAVGIFGVQAMEAVQNWRYWFWHSWVGTVALYGSLVVHPFFALLRVAERRTFKMPAREMLQIALGLAIPLLLVDHIINTRVMGAYFHVDESYHSVLRRLWPYSMLTQSLLLLLVWAHGMIGIHFLLRSRESYRHWRDVFLLGAILVPLLALIGFFVGAREAQLMGLPPELVTRAQRDMVAFNVTSAKAVFYGLVGCFMIFVAAREIRVRTTGQITMRFVGHGTRRLAPGPTVLEMFRRFGIPHAALCRPGSGQAGLPDPAARRPSGADPARLPPQCGAGQKPRARRDARPPRPHGHGRRSQGILGTVRAAAAARADRAAQSLLRRDEPGDHRP